MVRAMEISGNSLLAAFGFQSQTPAAAQARPAAPAPKTAPAPALKAAPNALPASLSRAENLSQAVQVLSDQGRLPPRGSLVDLRV